MAKQDRMSVFVLDSIAHRIKGFEPVAEAVPYGTDVKGVYFDGYPQIVKENGSPAGLWCPGGKRHYGAHAGWRQASARCLSP